jgi:hypothetical protein
LGGTGTGSHGPSQAGREPQVPIRFDEFGFLANQPGRFDRDARAASDESEHRFSTQAARAGRDCVTRTEVCHFKWGLGEARSRPGGPRGSPGLIAAAALSGSTSRSPSGLGDLKLRRHQPPAAPFPGRRRRGPIPARRRSRGFNNGSESAVSDSDSPTHETCLSGVSRHGRFNDASSLEWTWPHHLESWTHGYESSLSYILVYTSRMSHQSSMILVVDARSNGRVRVGPEVTLSPSQDGGPGLGPGHPCGACRVGRAGRAGPAGPHPTKLATHDSRAGPGWAAGGP